LGCTFIDDQRPETWKAALRPETKLFLVETITNPLMRVPRLQEVVEFARRERLTTVIDNTFASPVNFRPLSIGFDISFHSATKYLNGHSDLVAGCVLGSRERVERVRRMLNLLGGTLDPDRKSTRLNSSHVAISYAVFCLKKKKTESTSQ